MSDILAYNNKWLAYNSKVVECDPYNPLNLPKYTIRVKMQSGYSPAGATNIEHPSERIVTNVDSVNNVWDIYYPYDNWSHLFHGPAGMASPIQMLDSVLGANTEGITDMSYMFFGTSAVTLNINFNTKSVTNFSRMFYNAQSLTAVPKVDTPAAVDVSYMFYGCYYVESGALDMYNQMANQPNPPVNHASAFNRCGSATTTGQAELAQIPTSWGGTMA